MITKEKKNKHKESISVSWHTSRRNISMSFIILKKIKVRKLNFYNNMKKKLLLV